MEETTQNKTLATSDNSEDQISTLQIIIAIAIILIACGILVFAGYKLIKHFQSESNQDNNIENEGNINGDGAQDQNQPEEGWQLFVGNAFLIKYPDAWDVKSSSEKYVQFGPKIETDDITNVERIAVFIGSKLSTVSLPLKQEIEEFKNQSDYAEVVFEKDTTVDGIPAKEILLIEKEKTYTRRTISTFFEKDSVVWEIRGVTYRTDKKQVDEFLVIYEEMLTSLKIIN